MTKGKNINYVGETAENMQLSKCYLKRNYIKGSSAFVKHLKNSVAGIQESPNWTDCFAVEIVLGQ